MPDTDLASLAGMTDVAVRKATGRDWSEWIRMLDEQSAASLAHKEIASLLHRHHGLSPWWAQMLTVGYERIKGLRVKNQKANGFEISVSKTVAVDAHSALAAFTEPRQLRSWYGQPLKLRTATPGKSARFDGPGTRGVLVLSLTPKAPQKTSLNLQHAQLSAGEAESMRAHWKAALEKYKLYVEGNPTC